MSSFSRYFEKKGNSLIFTGDTLEIFVPSRYDIRGYLNITSMVRTIGFFDMLINGKIKCGYRLAATIEIIPSEIETITKGTESFAKLTLKNGDVFIKDLQYVEDAKISYVLFYEMTFSGHYPDFMKYKDCGTIYDYMAKITGSSFSTCHTIFEIIAMQVARDSKNISTLYRLTPMKNDPTQIGLHSIANVATSTSSRITGSYAKAGLESSIANASERNSLIEDILRE